jgi:hypothetical protein
VQWLYRERSLDMRLGSLQLRIPKLRQGSYFPPFLEPRKTAEKALVTVIQEAWIGGVSTGASTSWCRRWACHFGPTLRPMPSHLGNQRHVDHDRPSSCAKLQSPLAKCRALQPTLTKIAADCDRASRDISMPIADSRLWKMTTCSNQISET